MKVPVAWSGRGSRLCRGSFCQRFSCGNFYPPPGEILGNTIFSTVWMEDGWSSSYRPKCVPSCVGRPYEPLTHNSHTGRTKKLRWTKALVKYLSFTIILFTIKFVQCGFPSPSSIKPQPNVTKMIGKWSKMAQKGKKCINAGNYWLLVTFFLPNHQNLFNFLVEKHEQNCSKNDRICWIPNLLEFSPKRFAVVFTIILSTLIFFCPVYGFYLGFHGQSPDIQMFCPPTEVVKVFQVPSF